MIRLPHGSHAILVEFGSCTRRLGTALNYSTHHWDPTATWDRFEYAITVFRLASLGYRK